MRNWVRTTIAHCSTVVGDGLHGTPIYAEGGEYAFVNGNNLSNGSIIVKKDTKRLDVSEAEKYRKPLSSRTILVSINGTLGNFARYNGEKVILGKSACYFNVCNECDPIFMMYVVSTPQFKQYLQSVATGTTIKNVSLKQMRDYSFDLPPYDEQVKIASILHAIDFQMEINNAINDNLQKQAAALFKAWFVGYLPFGGSIPEDWQVLSFSDFLTARSEKSNDPALQMYSVTDTGIYPRDARFKKNLNMKQGQCKVVYATDLVFGMSREILNWGIMRDEIGGVSAAYNVFSVNHSVNTYYLEAYIRAHSVYFKDLIKPASREGQGIDKSALMKKRIVIPTQSILRRYYDLENPLTTMQACINAENQTLTKIRDSLLPRLMSGEIDVSSITL